MEEGLDLQSCVKLGTACQKNLGSGIRVAPFPCNVLPEVITRIYVERIIRKTVENVYNGQCL